MRKKSGIIKRALSLLLIFLLSINSFATSVSNNDGSAFITKAEFDALKSSFQAQIDTYNQSIDSKIDSAIASYLSGISISNESTMTSNITCFNYPLTVYNYLKDMVNLDSPSANQTKPFISIGYKFFGGLHRGREDSGDGAKGGTLGISLLDIPSGNKHDKWLHGNWSSNKFIVDGMSTGLDYTLTGAVYYDGDHDIANAPTDNEPGLICCDYSSVGTSELGAQGWNSTRITGSYKLYADYAINTNTDALLNIKLIAAIASGGIGTIWNYGTNALDTWRLTKPDGTQNTNIWVNRCATEDKLRSYTYAPSKVEGLSEIYNNGMYYDSAVTKYNNTTYKKYLAPVTIGAKHTINLTNLKKNREALNNPDVDKEAWWHHYDLKTGHHNPSLGVITAGLNIQSEYSGASGTSAGNVDKTKRNAVKTNNLYYKFKDIGNNEIEHHMVDGLPVLSIDNKFGENIERLTVNVDVNFPNTTNQKYVIFSSAPISTQIYSDNVESNLKYLKMTSVNGTAVNAKKAKLANGANTIVLDTPAIKGGEILYMKILWDDVSVADEFIEIKNVPNFIIKHNNK